MLAVSNLGKYFGEQTLFENLSVQFNTGERYGVVGANGSGKSTLLKILASEEPPSDGTVSMPKRARVGVLRQDHYRYEEERILDVVQMGNAELWAAMAEKERLLERADVEFDGDRYAELEDVIVRHDGYALESRAAEILEGLGIETERHHEPLSVLSGGFKLRVLLAQTLAADPDVLLLDEPTNHLDIVSIRWLEKFLVESFTGCTLVVSHDHRFLDNVSTAILDIDYGTGILYPGNYSYFEQAKVEERERREKEIDKRQKEIDDHQAFVDRFRAKATKARQAQSKVKLIEKISIEPLPQTSRRYPSFRFEQVRPSGKEVLTIKGVSKAYDKPVLDGVSLTVRRGERVAILGPNGIGKSTLLKIAMGKVAADAGTAEWGYEARVGYFAQDHREQLGDSKQSIEAWLWEICPAEPIGFVRGQLAAVLFSGDEVRKKISSLSGGEAARLIFCRHMVEKPNVLLLDEPSNHLDLEAIEALVSALERYPGTLIFVSHDRWFVQRLATRVVEITKDRLVDFQGSYDEYLERCGDDHLDSETVLRKAREAKRKGKAAAREREGTDQKELARRRKRLEGELASVNDQIAKTEARIHEINETFCDPTFFERTEPQKVRRLEQQQKDLSRKLDAMLAEWQGLEERLEELKEALAP